MSDVRPDGERLTGVAIRLENGLVVSKTEGRHCDLTRGLLELPWVKKKELYVPLDAQGFMTTKGRFVRRKPGEVIARLCGQLQGDLLGSVLTSEDLW